MQADGAKLLVMGHTHIPWRYETPEGTILNSGTCCRGQKMYASLDTLTGESRSIQCT
jgi:predicted phosphodiesterase